MTVSDQTGSDEARSSDSEASDPSDNEHESFGQDGDALRNDRSSPDDAELEAGPESESDEAEELASESELMADGSSLSEEEDLDVEDGDDPASPTGGDAADWELEGGPKSNSTAATELAMQTFMNKLEEDLLGTGPIADSDKLNVQISCDQSIGRGDQSLRRSYSRSQSRGRSQSRSYSRSRSHSHSRSRDRDTDS